MGNLMLTRNPGESVEIGENIMLTVNRIVQSDEACRTRDGINSRVKLVFFYLDIDDTRTEISHKVGEIFNIDSGRGYQINVLVAEVRGYQVKLGFDAPSSIGIYRGELASAIRETHVSQAAVSS